MKRVVTGHDQNGKSAVVAAGMAPRGVSADNGIRIDFGWQTVAAPALLGAREDLALAMSTFVPAATGTTFVLVEFPGNTQSGMHATDSIDYVTVVSGEVWLVLEDGSETLLQPGDTVIQNGTQHDWHNRRTEPCLLAAVLVGAARQDEVPSSKEGKEAE